LTFIAPKPSAPLLAMAAIFLASVAGPSLFTWNAGTESDKGVADAEQRDALSAATAAGAQNPPASIIPPVMTAPSGAAAVEQRSQGARPGAERIASFDGLGVGFEGPQGTANLRNPSDNSLAVGKDHVFQIVNTRMAIFTKKGKRFKTTGNAIYGPVPTNTIFKGFGGACEATNNGDAVVRYDQLPDRWLVVMPIFRTRSREAGSAEAHDQANRPGERAGQPGQPDSLRRYSFLRVKSDNRPTRPPICRAHRRSNVSSPSLDHPARRTLLMC
jgi:hypothetical protein